MDNQTVNTSTAHSLETVVMLLSESCTCVDVLLLESHVASPFRVRVDCRYEGPAYFSLKDEIVSGVVLQSQTESSL